MLSVRSRMINGVLRVLRMHRVDDELRAAAKDPVAESLILRVVHFGSNESDSLTLPEIIEAPAGAVRGILPIKLPGIDHVQGLIVDAFLERQKDSVRYRECNVLTELKQRW